LPDTATPEEYVAPHERKWKRPWQSAFLRAMSVVDDATSACRLASVSKTTAYRTREDSPEFALAWDEAREHARDLIERTAHQWITTGVPVKRKRTRTVTKTVGAEVTETTTTTEETEGSERSATLMIFWLKAHYPDRYRFAEKVEHGGTEGSPVRIESVSALDAQIEQLSAELQRRATAAGLPPVPEE